MSHSTPTRVLHSKENDSGLAINKENVTVAATPRQRKALGAKTANSTPTYTPTKATHKPAQQPRIGHRPEKHDEKFRSIRQAERLTLGARSPTIQDRSPRLIARSTMSPRNDENVTVASVLAKSPFSKVPIRHSTIKHSDTSFEIWVDEAKPIFQNKQEAKAAAPDSGDEENHLPSKHIKSKPSQTRARTQRGQSRQPVVPERKKISRRPLSEIDVHDLPEYKDLLRDTSARESSPTPASQNISSSRLRSPSWTDSQAVLSQALEQAEETAKSLLSDIKNTKAQVADLTQHRETNCKRKSQVEPEQRDQDPVVVATQYTNKEVADDTEEDNRSELISQPLEDVFNSASPTKTVRDASPSETVTKEVTVTTTTVQVTKTTTRTLHKRRSDETDSPEALLKKDQDNIKKRLRPRKQKS
ncbi:hypothetical protein INT43_001447 [Umbelopsis isabellina]|uniref:Uncharacterized protein n=1 Tax=Mortierella isabellina TaxID=91625 RepID=A0A8H7PDM5_MORIS|nr:hypothetical protein INT43_001447 [Umbelopsis isabellina]